jgi:hypothetical protein
MRTYDFAPLFRSTIGFDRLPRRIAINGASAGDNVHQIEAKAA